LLLFPLFVLLLNCPYPDPPVFLPVSFCSAPCPSRGEGQPCGPFVADRSQTITVRTPNFRKANFQFFKEIVSRTSWEMVLRYRGPEQSWQIFKDTFHTAQELSFPRCKKLGKEGKRPAWWSQDLMVKLKSKRELHRQWKQGQGRVYGCCPAV